MNVRPGHTEDVLIFHELVLEILSHVVELVGGTGQRRSRRGTREHLTSNP